MNYQCLNKLVKILNGYYETHQIIKLYFTQYLLFLISNIKILIIIFVPKGHDKTYKNIFSNYKCKIYKS